MEPAAKALAALILLLAAVWWLWQGGASHAVSDVAAAAMTGCWHAPPDFCLDSGLAAMQLMLSAPRKDGTRLAHLAAIKEDGTPVADSFAVVSVAGETGWRSWLSAAKGAVEKDWVRLPARFKSEGRSLFPAAVDFLVNPRTGQMRVHGKKKVWAKLEKDTAASQALH